MRRLDTPLVAGIALLAAGTGLHVCGALRQMDVMDPSTRQGYPAALDAARALTAERVWGTVDVVVKPLDAYDFLFRPVAHDFTTPLFDVQSVQGGEWTVCKLKFIGPAACFRIDGFPNTPPEWEEM